MPFFARRSLTRLLWTGRPVFGHFIPKTAFKLDSLCVDTRDMTVTEKSESRASLDPEFYVVEWFRANSGQVARLVILAVASVVAIVVLGSGSVRIVATVFCLFAVQPVVENLRATNRSSVAIGATGQVSNEAAADDSFGFQLQRFDRILYRMFIVFFVVCCAPLVLIGLRGTSISWFARLLVLLIPLLLVATYAGSLRNCVSVCYHDGVVSGETLWGGSRSVEIVQGVYIRGTRTAHVLEGHGGRRLLKVTKSDRIDDFIAQLIDRHPELSP